MGNYKSKILYEIKSFMISLVISFIAVFLLTNYVVKPVSVEGISMYPTLQDEDICLSFLFNLNEESIERFDIVVVDLEEENKFIVKRVVGLPHDTVAIKDEVLYINHEPVEQPFLDTYYALSEKNVGSFTSDMNEIKLGDDEFFMMGDNRSNSLDSRYYGAFHSSEIVSKGIFVLYPFNRFGVK